MPESPHRKPAPPPPPARPPAPLQYHNPAAEREARRRWRRHRLAMAFEGTGNALTWIILIALIVAYVGTRLARIFGR